jgi:hypothetical protein
VPAFWSSLIVLCLLAAPMRPNEPEIREQSDTHLGVAGRHGVVAPMFRRSGATYTHADSPFVAPDIEIEGRPTRTNALVSLDTQSPHTGTSIVLTRWSRGPPLRLIAFS